MTDRQPMKPASFADMAQISGDVKPPVAGSQGDRHSEDRSTTDTTEHDEWETLRDLIMVQDTAAREREADQIMFASWKDFADVLQTDFVSYTKDDLEWKPLTREGGKQTQGEKFGAMIASCLPSLPLTDDEKFCCTETEKAACTLLEVTPSSNESLVPTVTDTTHSPRTSVTTTTQSHTASDWGTSSSSIKENAQGRGGGSSNAFHSARHLNPPQSWRPHSKPPVSQQLASMRHNNMRRGAKDSAEMHKKEGEKEGPTSNSLHNNSIEFPPL